MYPPGYSRDAHENAMGHDRPEEQEDMMMTAEERAGYLRVLCLQALKTVMDAADGDLSAYDAASFRSAFHDAIKERMAQAAQVWTSEVER